jgi:PAS domain S-box-containing protein
VEKTLSVDGTGRKASILLVDDREQNLLTLELVLRDLGQELVRASSGPEALRQLLMKDFAVVLLDVRMPEMDGFETAELIRKRPKSRNTPIIFVTALDASPEDITRGYSVGAVDFLFRPFMPEVLKAKVKVFLELFESREVLRASELRFSTLVKNIPGAMYRRSAQSPWDVHFVSDPIGEISGYPARDFMAGRRRLTDLIVPEDVPRVTETLQRALQERKPYALEYRLRRADRSVRWMLDKGQEMPGTEGVLRVLDGVIFDISEQKMAEEELRQRTDQLSVANLELKSQISERMRAEDERRRMSAQLLQGQKLQAIGQLAAGIAHEINNPVGYILSNAGTGLEYLAKLTRLLQAAEGVARKLDSAAPSAAVRQSLDRYRRESDAAGLLKDFRDAMRDIKGGAERIRDIVKSLREFTHLDPGDWRPARLEELTESAIRLCWNEIKYKAEVTREFATLPPIDCHPQQIEQVIVNLLVNAAQAIETKGQIHISLRLEDAHAVLRVRDSGQGIAAEHQPKLFEPFFTTKPVGQGTGLGLHVIHKIVQAHEGTIDVESTVGRGTEFTIRLPYLKHRRPEEGASDPAGARQGGERVVVVVDDDAPTLNSIRQLLKEEPYRLLTTAVPQQALQWVREREVSVVVSDQRMPDMAGTQLFERISKWSPATARILLTAYPDSAEVVELNGRVDAVLAKPWDGEHLKRAIRERVDGRPVTSRGG